MDDDDDDDDVDAAAPATAAAVTDDHDYDATADVTRHFNGRADHATGGRDGPAVRALQTVAGHRPSHVPHHTGPLEGQDLRTGQQVGRSDRGGAGPQPHRQPTPRRTEPEETRPLPRYSSIKRSS